MHQLTRTQIACQTQFTREGHRNMNNRKPFRTADQRKIAREVARKCEDGAFRVPSNVYFKITR